MRIILALLLCGCAGQQIHGYQWVADPSLPHCERMAWAQVDQGAMRGLCSYNGIAPDPRVIACAQGCMVFSPLSAAEAKQYDEWGESLYQHEERHVLGRMSHP